MAFDFRVGPGEQSAVKVEALRVLVRQVLHFWSLEHRA